MRLKLVSLLIILSGLSACSTTEKPTKNSDSINTSANALQNQATSADAIYKLALNRTGADKIQLLYSARDAAISEQSWPLLENICNELEQTPSVDKIQNRLYIAYAQKQQNKNDQALVILQSLDGQLKQPEHFAWHQYLTASIYASQNFPKRAAPYFFRASETANKNNIEIPALQSALWDNLTKLSSYALERFNRGSVIQQGWTNLALYHQVYANSGVELDQAINNWRRRYPGHPAVAILPEQDEALADLAPVNIERLAVLLPQSGANERLGDALKAGILAGLDKQTISDTVFIDENLSTQVLSEQLSQFNPDFVIGPLLKANIDKLAQAKTLIDTPTLHLNTFDGERLSLQHYFFALNPEHEVQQALEHFLAKGYQKPMLLAPNNANGQRLVDYFNIQWQRYSETKPQIGFYNDNKDMPNTITSLLEVDKSKQRIKTVKSLFKQEVESETRSRSDIDAIYILGDAIETRLIKPYLDVNVSTFAQRIPLYASSKSHSKQIDRTDKGDLEGLYFTELPWMLNATVKQHNLRNQYNTLWPENADISQRLFAMAYDAVSVLSDIRQLSVMPGNKFTGLSGKLSVNTSGHIERTLDWAQYTNRRIKAVQLETKQPVPLFMQSANESNTLTFD
ncbi:MULTISPECIES: penicillin-binding protein activator [Pseudoalteromonas]|uniref:Penicillin-binding protein activator n=1 Tax=Pseudoalteromonas agarivorans TaxID=176102 RepID=A0AAD0U486_9GAMM|nr:MULTISPECIES: penicillin-binding protein activator [Pseudoalteromonas]MCK8096666.1 penicillin-binding protein activator [Pseudoalteromonas sp. 1CM17D]MDC9520045.1 penicillin-binding protein activator [Pseudoalteromonas sp. Angola-31]AYM87630.1 penicillin-binding protein activator [Pseudoalteromonas agarivorans]MDC9502105.1 penicillin-binding protein activator [Pseudoalteromonas sp. Angola-18]MDI3245244.1 penicillin-binding protein activator [Pseudoalteromonas agarivorans]